MEMKRNWVKPLAVVQQFVPNEYVAACWKINCNVPVGYGYLDNNGNGAYDWGDTLLTPRGREVRGCGTYHSGVEGVPDDGPVANAMWHPSRGGKDYEVYYWRDGKGTYDVHFSKVDDAEWETNPNAS